MHAPITYQVPCDMEMGKKRSVVKYLVKYKNKISEQLSIPCDECTCLHAVIFTTYGVKNCKSAPISFALSCPNVTSSEILKG